jgi:uracil-DNA glycosylase
MIEINKREKLKEYYLSIKECRECVLCNTRTKFVFGSGSADAELLLIGEAPGKNEDIQGKPFVGQAGKILDELLDHIGLKREEVFIANVLKCRPPTNRDPKIEEINTCKKYLEKQIEIIDPKVICTLGKHSTQLVLDTNMGITSLRGKIFNIGNRTIIPINHPAAALYNRNKMDLLFSDFKRVEIILKKSDSDESLKRNTGSENEEKKETKIEQLGFF